MDHDEMKMISRWGNVLRLSLLLLLCLAFACPPSLAATIHVPVDQPTIQGGIDAAQDGDTVLVAPGTYVENIDFLGKAITVESSDGPEVTTIDGSEPGSGSFSSVVYFRSGEKFDTVLSGFTITGGTGEYYFIQGALGLSYAYLFGGGIYCSGSSPTVSGNIITGNSVTFFPAGRLRGGLVMFGYGGGIYTSNSSAVIDSNQIVSNIGADLGGGIYARSSDVTISQNTISDNYSGGIWLANNDHTFCINNTVTGNQYVGGIATSGSDPAVIGNLISNNVSLDLDGAGISSYNGDLRIGYNIITNNTAEDNAHDLTGGGLCFRYCSALLENNLVAFNSVDADGGGLFAEHSEIIVEGNTLAGNTAAGRGGGIFLTDTTFEASESIFSNNSAPAGPEGYLFGDEGPATAVFTYSDLVGGEQSIQVGEGSTLDLGEGVINADPRFTPGPNGGYYLSQIASGQILDSPCVDTGDPLSPLIEGTTRTDEVIDTNVMDMGFHYPASQWEYICAAPSGFDHALLPTDPPVEDRLLIWSCSDSMIPWSLQEDEEWLILSHVSGTSTPEFQSVIATVDPAGLDAGKYLADVVLGAPGAVTAPWHCTILLRVGEILIDCVPSSLYFSAGQGGKPPEAQTLEIRSGDLGSISWSAGSAATWISLDPVSGSSSGEGNPVTVSIDQNGLPSGEYDAEIVIEAPEASNSPFIVAAHLLVGEMEIAYTPFALSFEAHQGEGPPPFQYLRVRNAGTGEMPWSLTAGEPWLSVSPETGVSDSSWSYVQVSVDHQGLGYGEYHGEITIQAPEAVNSPQTVPVTLAVPSRVIGFAPEGFYAEGDYLGGSPPDQELQVWNIADADMVWVLSDDAEWLSFDQTTGVSSGEHDHIQVHFDQADLQPGQYWATITLSAYGATNSPQFLYAILLVDDQDPVLRLITGPGPAPLNPPLIRVFPPEQDSAAIREFSAYSMPRYGVNISSADVINDSFDEIITGAGPGAIYGPHVRGFRANGTPLPDLSFLAYGTNKYGVTVAGGELDGDGFDEIVTGAGPGEVFGPHVRAFDYDGTPGVTPVPGVSFFAYGTPKWGVNVACGDIDGDGFDEIITGPGPGMVYGPHVRGWNVDGGPVASIPGVSFLAYGTNMFGVNVAACDVDGDGIDEICTGAGPGTGFGPHVRGWNYDGVAITSLPGYSFFAWRSPPLTHGVKVFAGIDLNRDGREELLAGRGPAPGADTEVRIIVYDGSLAHWWISLDAYPELSQGVNVAAGRF